ncbi:MAG: GNAT family N-acetyltransferase [Propionibacteriaceae bacterium]|nr:GNAT family N-acetyltransferase [Propionibacteriaceae bacterium]
MGAHRPGPLFPKAHKWPVTLEWADIVLAPFRRRDANEWNEVRARNYDWLRPWDATPPDGVPSGDTAAMLRRFHREAKAGRLAPWVIRDGAAKGRPLIGQCTLNNVQMGSARLAAVGYWIARDFAGRGIVPLATALACDYAMQVMGVHRIEICVRPENTASLRVAEKLGFRCEGLRPRYIHINGEWRDHKVFALDSSEVGPGLLRRVEGVRR